MDAGSVSALPRRTVVVAGAAGAAALAVTPRAQARVVRRAPGRGRWDELVGTTFTATLAGRRVVVRLDEVLDVGAVPAGLAKRRLAQWRRKTFRLVFTARQELEQGTWTLRHPRTGRIQVFLVPGGPVPPGTKKAGGARAGKGRTSASAVFNGWKG